MSEASEFGALAYAVRGRVLARHMGQLCPVQAVLMVPPVFVAVATGSHRFAWRSGTTAAIVLGAGLLLSRLRAPGRIQRNEALAVSALAFLLAPVVMALSVTSFDLSFIDAWFETVSGVTTTGLTVLPSVEGRPAALLFLRAWMQWYGGLGIVVLSVALLVRPGASIRRLSAVEFAEDDLVGGIRAHARRVTLVYVGLTAGGILLLTIVGVPAWTGLLHALAAVSTGGFSSLDDSLDGLGGWGPRAAVMLLSLTNEDLVNILAAATGQTLGFPRVVARIENAEYRDVCTQLNVGTTIVPNETISRYLADMVEGQDILELSTIVKGPARFFSFIASDEEAGTRIDQLDLPDKARVICIYRGDDFLLPDDDDRLKKDDDVVILTDRSNIETLRERWQPRSAGEAGGSTDHP